MSGSTSACGELAFTEGQLPIEISINRPAAALSEMASIARVTERAGFHTIRIGDMQSTSRELYCALTLVAEHTSTLRFGPGVTNPVTRHPSVAASALASLHAAVQRTGRAGYRAW
ncbi:LLM class flavin-dependent oxidoreductase [Aeromicrobium sp. UC242_57]|uniref:LLM class flavin-dependent oxidoreductase n=1 Tax=Aeromicrobium sp. UC242_57 TaxID=3374624 RepID=UPI0037932036